MPNHALLKSRIRTKDMEYDQEAGRRYGFLPRMKRMEITHQFLWYLTYGYKQSPASSVPSYSGGTSLDDNGTSQEGREDSSTSVIHQPAQRRHNSDPIACGEDVFEESTLKVCLFPNVVILLIK